MLPILKENKKTSLSANNRYISERTFGVISRVILKNGMKKALK